MKRGSTLLVSIILLLAVGLFGIKSSRQELTTQVQALGAQALNRQLGTVATLAESPSPSILPASPSPERVPVTTVEEAWDEQKRATEPITTSPEPITVDGGGTLELRNETGYTVELDSLPALSAPVENLTVLIMHTHGSESYTDPNISGYRTQDETRSVIAIGETIRTQLESQGICVIHDKTLCDYPEYTGAYNRSRTVISENLSQHPEITLVLDIHRDAVEDAEGNQMRMACTLESGESAQLMLVVGTDAGGLDHPNWQTNLSLGAILQMELSAQYPGLMRPLNLRTERFNQDLAPMTLLVEVGSSGNSLEEAKNGAKLFAQTLSQVLLSLKGQSS